ncbi:MAG: restriction endonuclease subunit S [Acidobacteriia bacterium]|nr:restriction endonuclease subunit S [Terriglobia bacterium]
MSKGWPVVQLGEVLSPYQEYIESPELRPYPKLSVKLYGRGVVLDSPADGGALKMKRHQLARAGQVILSEIWGKKGAIGFVPPNGDGALCTSHFFLFDIRRDKLEPKWLQAIFDANYLAEQLDVEAKGTTGYAAVRPKHLLRCEIPLPPLAEQRRIVAQIEALAAQIQEARSLRHQAVEEATVFGSASLSAVFASLETIHDSSRLGDICEVVRGGSPRPAGSPVYYGGKIPFIKVGDLTKDESKYLFEASASVNELGRQHSRFVEAGTLMLTNSGATLGVPKITTIAACFNDGSQAFLNLSPALNREFLYYFFRSKTLWLREQLARGQGQPNLNTDMTKHMLVPVPPLPEQRRIVAYFDDLQAKTDAVKALQTETSAQLDALLPSILDKAFRGEL